MGGINKAAFAVAGLGAATPFCALGSESHHRTPVK